MSRNSWGALPVDRPLEDGMDRLANLGHARLAGLEVEPGAGPGHVRGDLRLLLGVTGDDRRHPAGEGGLHAAVAPVGRHHVGLRQQPGTRDERRGADVGRNRPEAPPAGGRDHEDVLAGGPEIGQLLDGGVQE
jgi:hypothetical protein